MTGPFSTERVRAAYDAAADAYHDSFGDDLAELPLDRHVLDWARSEMKEGLVLDLGCGTGSAGSYVKSHGASVLGVDLSSRMLRYCAFPVCQGDMRALPFRDGAFAAIVAYFSIQHVDRRELDGVLGEVARVLGPEGTLVLSTHLGEGEVSMEEFLGTRIETTGGTLYALDEITDRISSMGFVIETRETRDPLAHEYPSRRVFVGAKRAV